MKAKTLLFGFLAGLGGVVTAVVVGKIWYYIKVIFIVERILKAQNIPIVY